MAGPNRWQLRYNLSLGTVDMINMGFTISVFLPRLPALLNIVLILPYYHGEPQSQRLQLHSVAQVSDLEYV